MSVTYILEGFFFVCFLIALFVPQVTLYTSSSQWYSQDPKVFIRLPCTVQFSCIRTAKTMNLIVLFGDQE